MKRKTRFLILMITMLVVALSISVISSASATDNSSDSFDYSYTDIVNRLIDPKTLSVSGNGEDSNLFSSYGRKSAYNEETGEYENWNNNGDGAAYISKIDDDGDGNENELLLAEMNGAGYISRIWSAQPESGHLKIYIDEGEDYGYVIDMPFIDYFDLTGFNYDNLCYTAARGYNCYVPITYNKSCRVVAYSGWGRFYQINYTQLADGTTVQPLASNGGGSVAFTEAQAAALNTVNAFLGSKIGTNPSGSADAEFETYSLKSKEAAVKEFSGKGAVSGILVKINNIDRIPDNSEEMIALLKTLRLKAYWDGSDAPAIDVPLGDFFASSYGIDSVQMLLLGVRDDRTFYSYYYMPYLNGAKIVIENMGDTDIELQLSVTTEELSVSEDKVLYFNSVFSFGEYVENRYPDHRFLSVSGEGRFVGVNLHLYKSTDYKMDESIPGHNWWGEGDEKFFVDGEKFPSWFGTGTEDFFGYAWCSQTLFTEAYHAQSYFSGGSYVKGNHVVTRLMMTDSVAFKTSFEGCLEKYYEDTNYAYTSYLYLSPTAAVDRPDYTIDDTLEYFVMDNDAYVQPLIEGENLIELSYDGTISSQDMKLKLNWSGDSHLFWKPSSTAGQALTLSLPAGASKRYMILASFTNAPNFGVFSVSVNGNTIKEEIDLYASSVICESLTELGAVDLIKGYYGNTITFTLNGVNEANTSGNAFFGLDFLLLIPCDEYEGIGEVNLSQYCNVSRKNCAVTNFIEGEAMHVASSHATGTGKYEGQLAGGGLSRGEQLFWRPTFGNNAWIELYLPAAESGNYAIYASFMKASDFGIFETYVNGIKIGAPFDGYNSSLVVEGITLLGTAFLTEGYESNTIRFKMIGKNDENTTDKYYMGLDFITLVPYGEELDFSEHTNVTREITPTTNFFEAESLGGTANGGTVDIQSYPQRSNKAMVSAEKLLRWKNSGVGDTAVLNIPTLASGKYAVVTSFLSAKDYGKFCISMNGITLMPELDLYDSVVTTLDLTYLGVVELTEGYTNTMTITNIGKNDSSSGYIFGLDFLMLIPYDEYDGLGEIDLTKYTTADRENAKHGLLIEGENLFVNKAPAAYQYHSNWSNQSHYYWNESGTATANLPAPADGEYILAIAYTKAKDFGMYQIAVNGTNVGCYQDLYNNGLKRNDINIVGKVKLFKGYNTMTIKNVGKNASATNTLFGIDFIYLIPVSEYFGAEYVDVSGYTVRTVSAVIDETHTFDDDADKDCNTCGAQRSSIYTAPEGAVTKYGTIPPQYVDISKYPLAVFQNGEFMGAYSKFGASTDDCAIGRAKQLTDGSLEGEKGSTVEILLRADVCVDYHYPNVCQILGNIIIDLNGFTLSQTNNLAVFYNEAKYWKGMEDAVFTVKDGQILLNSGGLFRIGAFGTYDDYATDDYYKTSKYTFDNVTFTLAKGAVTNSFIGQFVEKTNIGSSGCSEYMLMNITFKENCVIDIRNAPENFILFEACDPVTDKALVSGGTNYYATNSIVQVNVGACEIKTGKNSVVLLKEYGAHPNGAESYVKFVPDSNGKFASLIATAEMDIAQQICKTSGGVECMFVKTSENDGYVNYSLYPKVMVGYKIKTSVTLYSNFVYNVYIPEANFNKAMINGVDANATLVEIDGVNYYHVAVNLPVANSLNDIKLTVRLNSGSTTVDANWTLSVLNYAKSIVNGSYDEVTNNLVKDMLVYASAAYTYFGEKLAEEKTAEISTLLDSYTKDMPETSAVNTTSKTYFSDVVISLAEVPSFRFYLNGDYTAEDFTFKVGTRNVEATLSEDGKYLEITMYAYMMLDTVSYTVTDSTTGECVTEEYNLYSYYEHTKAQSDTNLVNIVEALIKYSTSAKNYRNSVIDAKA